VSSLGHRSVDYLHLRALALADVLAEFTASRVEGHSARPQDMATVDMVAELLAEILHQAYDAGELEPASHRQRP
jgi:hypothetical protein